MIEIDEIEPLEKSVDYDNLLADYKDAKVEVEQPSEPVLYVPQSEESKAQPQQPDFSASKAPYPNPNWKGDNRYWQRGSKKGTPRDVPYTPPFKAQYNHEAQTTIQATMLINGATFLMFINFIVPILIVAINNWLTPTEKLAFKDLKFDEKEKKELEPMMDATLKQLNITGNPLLFLCIMLVGGYTAKFMEAKLNLEVEKAITKPTEK